MRLDAREGDTDWKVYHAERCEMLREVVWVDDEIRQWAEVALPVQVDPATGDSVLLRAFEAKKIEIIPLMRLVVINPIEDVNDASADEARELPVCAA
jgi:hypothetical protein